MLRPLLCLDSNLCVPAARRHETLIQLDPVVAGANPSQLFTLTFTPMVNYDCETGSWQECSFVFIAIYRQMNVKEWSLIWQWTSEDTPCVLLGTVVWYLIWFNHSVKEPFPLVLFKDSDEPQWWSWSVRGMFVVYSSSESSCPARVQSTYILQWCAL